MSEQNMILQSTYGSVFTTAEDLGEKKEKSNLVTITGRINSPGAIEIPENATLRDVIGLVGGIKNKKQLVLIGGAYSKKWIFSKAWDKFQLPKPFSKVICVVGEPITIPKDINPKEYCDTIGDILLELNEEAEDIMKQKK